MAMEIPNDYIEKLLKRAAACSGFNAPGRMSPKKTRFFMDNELLSGGYLSVFPKWVLPVYAVLCKHANVKTQTCFPSLHTIMREGGISNKNYAIQAIRILENAAMIAVDRSRGRNVNLYKLLSHTVWKPANSIMHDTFLVVKSPRRTVSKDVIKRYQEDDSNGTGGDTRSHSMNSDKKIIAVDTPSKGADETPIWHDPERIRRFLESSKDKKAGFT